jgi:hypothetical protein
MHLTVVPAKLPGRNQGWVQRMLPGRRYFKRAFLVPQFLSRLLLTGLGALLLPAQTFAVEVPRAPLRVATWLDRQALRGTPQDMYVSQQLALGLLAFNSPYLFGGKALRSQLTCGACHSQEGLSGAALRLSLRGPVPDLRAAASHTDVAAFVTHAIKTEFDGPPLSQQNARALAALSDVLAPMALETKSAYRVDGSALIAIGLRLTVAFANKANAGTEELDFVIDSLRFLLGEMQRGKPTDADLGLLDETNRALRAVMGDLEDAPPAKRQLALMPLQSLAERWEALRTQTAVLRLSQAPARHE